MSKQDLSRRHFIGALGTVGAAMGIIPLTSAKADCDPAGFSSFDRKNYESYWEKISDQFDFDKGLIHLNTGTEGSVPSSVQQLYFSHIQRFSGNPMNSAFYDPTFSYVQSENKGVIAAYLNINAADLVLTGNTTDGMNLVLHGFPFKAKDEVICTMHDHSAATGPLHVLRDRLGIVVKQISIPTPAKCKDELVAAFKAAITNKTKMIVVSHINYTTGLRMPVKEICALAQKYNIATLIDGAHTPGMIQLDLTDLGCDFYSAAGHKWLNGPAGTGMLYVKNSATNPWGLWPVNTELYDNLATYGLTTVMQIRGQPNAPAFTALRNAVEFTQAIGQANIEARILAINASLKSAIAATWKNATIFSPSACHAELCSGLVAFNPFKNILDATKISTLASRLQTDYNIWSRSVTWQESPSASPVTALRVSTHIFNTPSQLVSFMTAAYKVVADLGN